MGSHNIIHKIAMSTHNYVTVECTFIFSIFCSERYKNILPSAMFNMLIVNIYLLLYVRAISLLNLLTYSFFMKLLLISCET